jgi:hypothetical protein
MLVDVYKSRLLLIMVLRLARTPPLDVDSLLVIEYDGRIW